MKHQAQTWIEFQSISLLKQFQQHLKDNAEYQSNGHAANYGIIKTTGRSFYSELSPFTILQKLCKDFDQIANDSIQWGDMSLTNIDGKANDDTPKASTLTQTKARCWYNIKVSTRVSAFSQLQ